MTTIEEAHIDGIIGATRAASAVSEDWKSKALSIVLELASGREDFHVDDVWDAGLPETNSNRAIGDVLKRAKKLGAIEKTDRMRPSVRSHGSGKPVWRSLVYDRTSS
jgi:hypothetical protein